MDTYDGSQIVILEGLEAVRKRPGMYIGSTGTRGLHHLIWEILDNGIDEHLAGFCTQLGITLTRDGGVVIEDNGRGVPVDIHPTKKIPTVRVVYTILHAGGKFNNSVYKVSGGLHGVGASVVNALSKSMIVEVKKDGKIYRDEYKDGGKPVVKLENGLLPVVGKCNKSDTGTKGNLISSLQEETFAEGLFLLRKNWNCAIIYVSILSPNFVWCQEKEEAR